MSRCYKEYIQAISLNLKAFCPDATKNVVSKKCIIADCDVIANFGNKGESPIYCKQHAKDGMKDIKNKQCKEEDCETQPSFGYPNESASYCKEHALSAFDDNTMLLSYPAKRAMKCDKCLHIEYI